MRIYTGLILAVMTVSTPAFSADIAREINQSAPTNRGFVEFGISLIGGKLPLVGFNDLEVDGSTDLLGGINLGFESRLEYKGFFLEFIENSFSHVTLGFTAHESDNSHHEVIVTSLFSDIERSELEGLELIRDRQHDFNAGIRSSYYFGSYIAQMELVADFVNSHNGVVAALHFGHQKQVRNWNLHGLAGVRYFSDNVVDHLFGVTANEASEQFPEYVAGHGFMPTIQLGAALPLNEKWVFRATAEYARLPGAVADSPLAQGDSIYSVQAGVYYVLFGG